MSNLEARRAARRAAMPITQSLLDEYAKFSPAVIYAQENGITAGRKPQDENAFDIPPGYGMPTHTAKAKK
jgi:hypothetical protein